MEFKGRVAVVTGGASGIGAGCAKRLRDDGAEVVTWDIDGDCDVRCDVRNEQSVKDALAQTIAKHGTPTLLVASAGIGGQFEEFHKVTTAGWDNVFAINMRGVFLTMREVSNSIINARLDGALIAIASVNGVIADPVSSVYSATKAGVIHMCRCAAIDLGPYRIRVNAVGPGPTETPAFAPLLTTENYLAEIEAATPLGRIGTVELVADGVSNIMRSDWITGQAIMVDGGASLATARGQTRKNAHMKIQGARAAGGSH